MVQRIDTTIKRITNHYELNKEGTPTLYTSIDAFNIVMREFGGEHEYTTPDNYLGNDNKKSVEYKFSNGLKVHGDFTLNKFKQYQLDHVVFGR